MHGNSKTLIISNSFLFARHGINGDVAQKLLIGAKMCGDTMPFVPRNSFLLLFENVGVKTAKYIFHLARFACLGRGAIVSRILAIMLEICPRLQKRERCLLFQNMSVTSTEYKRLCQVLDINSD